MNVTPLSMQMVVPQSTEAGQVQHNLNQAGALQQSFENVKQKEDARLTGRIKERQALLL